ncbi:MAG: FAD-dependent oxidoreductase [Elainella sp. C42_A2020_010]|nr:FAD-dependent oxidoreductase [Elainella sp. C42_A2020_010]
MTFKLAFKFKLVLAVLLGSGLASVAAPVRANPTIDETVECDLLVAGGGLAGAATAYESLLAGRTVCLTEITDWVGGQISSQGTSALDERTTQREQDFFPRGYKEFTQRLRQAYQQEDPGDCWVSVFCFLPSDGHAILFDMLQDAEKRGNGRLHWFPNTVVKDLDLDESGTQIQSAIAIQHQPAPGAPPLNTEPLSATIEDAYRFEDSARFSKNVIQFVPNGREKTAASATLTLPWYVIDATETGELVALADVPYRVGIDPLTHYDPSSASESGDPYCTQGYTYTFAMEATADPQPQVKPEFYEQYAPYYSYERQNLASFNILFTYRRIFSPEPRPAQQVFGVSLPHPGDISMQNWTWGNDYRPGTAADNLILTHDQLEAAGQLAAGGWLGGLRVESLRRAEEAALGFYYWLVAGTTDSQLGDGVKQPQPNNRLLTGLDSPMGTVHGLSKYPYMREVRRIIGRPSPGYASGFTIGETDVSRNDYTDPHYQTLAPEMYRNLGISLSGLEAIARIRSRETPDPVRLRARSRIYPDSVGIGHYNIDFHPCMALSPPERPGNYEYPGVRQGQGETYPFQIPLRAMIPQRIDNFLIAGKSIATSYIAAAAYRVHSFEWSAGAAAGVLVDFALDQGIAPYELVDELPRREPDLEALQRRLLVTRNPFAFPGTSIFNLDWEEWR